jgi:hypothetical protein
MNLRTPLDPFAPVSPVEFERIALEKIKIHCREFISPALLEDLRFERDRLAERIGQGIAYRVEAMVYGREAWEQTVEKRTETGKTTKEEDGNRVIRRYEKVPETWWDHTKSTLWQWLGESKLFVWAKEVHGAYSIASEPDEDDEWERDGPTIAERWAIFLDKWLFRRKGRIAKRTIEVETHEHKHYKVTPVTKHIEVKKHFHICPHLNIKSDRPHIEFLANISSLG